MKNHSLNLQKEQEVNERKLQCNRIKWDGLLVKLNKLLETLLKNEGKTL